MEKQKIDRMIDAFRSAMYQEFGVNEEGMVANPPGGSGGFSGSSAAKGPTAGYDKPMKIDGRRKYGIGSKFQKLKDKGLMIEKDYIF